MTDLTTKPTRRATKTGRKRTTYERRSKSTKARHYAEDEIDLATSLRELDSARRMIDLVRQAFVEADDPDHAMDLAFRRIGKHLRNPSMPSNTKLALGETLMHCVAVAELRIAIAEAARTAEVEGATVSDRLRDEGSRTTGRNRQEVPCYDGLESFSSGVEKRAESRV